MGVERVLVRCGTAIRNSDLRYQPCRVSWTFLGTTGTIYQASDGPFRDVIKAAEHAVLRGATSWKVTGRGGIILGVYCDTVGILSAAIDDGLPLEVIGN